MHINLSKKKIHLCLIAIGMIFTIVSLFHTNIWFDESYSVAMASHPFQEIWSIDIHDVHPIFYYYCLHVLYLIFGSNILVYRLFSWVCLCAIGIFGYTGIRKDFGEDCGIWFTFFAFFFPVNIVYAGEIRMYMLVSLLILLGTFYAHRIITGKGSIYDHLRMALFYILAAYTHYYGLLAAALVNLFLLGALIVNHKQRTYKDVLLWLLDAALQIGFYFPWVFVLLSQTSNVQKDFWIHWYWPKSFYEMILFQVSGNIDKESYVPAGVTAVLEASLCIYLIYNAARHFKEHGSETLLSFGTYIGVIAVAVLIGTIIHKIVIYQRYLLVCTSLLLFYFSYNFTKFGRKTMNAVFCAAILACSATADINSVKINYDASNQDPFTYLDENMQDGDAILVSNYNQDPNSFIAVARYLNHPLYYWNECKWMADSLAAYKAYSSDMVVVTRLANIKELTGRVWVIYANDDNKGTPVTHVYDAVIAQFNGTGEGTVFFKTKYKNIEYTIGLVTV